ncbi:hypothetical protein G6F68_018739 [Rhizopus microsporus]|nr:hypothetical protein G6F68_018739 [Rhizopus microsporus]
MRGQRHIHPVVDVGPLRVVVQLFREHGHPRHEAERRVEIREAEALLDGIARSHGLPACQRSHGDIGADTGGRKHAHDRPYCLTAYR